MAVPPESVLESNIDTEMFNSMIGAKIMAIVSPSTFSESPEHINTSPVGAVSISPGTTP